MGETGVEMGSDWPRWGQMSLDPLWGGSPPPDGGRSPVGRGLAGQITGACWPVIEPPRGRPFGGGGSIAFLKKDNKIQHSDHNYFGCELSNTN
jgi:hypothetical protein